MKKDEVNGLFKIRASKYNFASHNVVDGDIKTFYVIPKKSNDTETFHNVINGSNTEIILDMGLECTGSVLDIFHKVATDIYNIESFTNMELILEDIYMEATGDNSVPYVIGPYISLILFLMNIKKEYTGNITVVKNFGTNLTSTELYGVLEMMKHMIPKTTVVVVTNRTEVLNTDYVRPDNVIFYKNNGMIFMKDTTDKELRKAHNLEKIYRTGGFR